MDPPTLSFVIVTALAALLGVYFGYAEHRSVQTRRQAESEAKTEPAFDVLGNDWDHQVVITN